MTSARINDGETSVLSCPVKCATQSHSSAWPFALPNGKIWLQDPIWTISLILTSEQVGNNRSSHCMLVALIAGLFQSTLLLLEGQSLMLFQYLLSVHCCLLSLSCPCWAPLPSTTYLMFCFPPVQMRWLLSVSNLQPSSLQVNIFKG